MWFDDLANAVRKKYATEKSVPQDTPTPTIDDFGIVLIGNAKWAEPVRDEVMERMDALLEAYIDRRRAVLSTLVPPGQVCVASGAGGARPLQCPLPPCGTPTLHKCSYRAGSVMGGRCDGRQLPIERVYTRSRHSSSNGSRDRSPSPATNTVAPALWLRRGRSTSPRRALVACCGTSPSLPIWTRRRVGKSSCRGSVMDAQRGCRLSFGSWQRVAAPKFLPLRND